MISGTNRIFFEIIVIGLIIIGAVYLGSREFSQINDQLASLEEQISPLLENPLEEPLKEPIIAATSTDSEEPAAPEEEELSSEPQEPVNICDSLNCNELDDWNNSGSVFTCQDGNKTCACQTQAYFDYSCSVAKQKCVYSTTNSRTNKYNCSAPQNPDLLFQSPGFSPGTPVAEDEMFFWATVKNQGSGSAASSLSYLKIDGQKITESSTASLEGSGSVVVAWATGWSAVAGSHELEVCADGALQVSESNESNNCLKTTFTVGGAAAPGGGTVLLPDLIIESIDISPDPLSDGQLVSFAATVKNQGNASAKSSLTVPSLDLGNNGNWDEFPGAKTTPVLAINGSETMIWREVWTSVSGTHKIEICADAVSEPEFRMAESSETNNCLSKIVIVP